MTPEVLLALGRLSDPQLSPDKKTILYGVSYTDIASNRSVRNLFTVPVEGGDPTRLTMDGKSISCARWSPDGKSIFFLQGGKLFETPYTDGKLGKRILKARAKVYVADAAIRNAVLMDESLLSNPTELGKIVETSVYKHVAAFYYHAAASIGYFRDGGKGKEIDIVVEYPRIRPLLIEVKYREQAEVAEKDAISSLAGTASASFIITKRAEDYGIQKAPSGTPMLRIPAFAFLYLLGHAEQISYQEGL